MTTAIIGTGGIGSAIARQLASGGEALKLSSAGKQSAQSWPRRSAEPRGSPSTTEALCRVPMLSSLPCGFPC
ncbi:MAG: NAD(P)-binding domain-containing protein [Candidatus Dormiibacterota bacterium]|jgi:predicted dinucleotide-binding enzyme